MEFPEIEQAEAGLMKMYDEEIVKKIEEAGDICLYCDSYTGKGYCVNAMKEHKSECMLYSSECAACKIGG